MKKRNQRNSFLEGLSWLPIKFCTKFLQGKETLIEVDLNKIGVDIKFPFYIGYEREMGSLAAELRCFKIREPNNLKHFVKFVTEEDILLDVGANFGFFSVLGKKAKKIIAIEPMEECHGKLRTNLFYNGIAEKTKILEVALGDGNPVFMNKDESSNLSKVIENTDEGNYKVDSKPLKYFTNKFNVNCVKIDIEGYEWEIFSKQKIPEKINKIVLELHINLMGLKKAKELIRIFYSQGFIVKYLIEDMPLRFYPFIGIKTIFNRLTYVKENLFLNECIEEIQRGRGLKYLYLVRR